MSPFLLRGPMVLMLLSLSAAARGLDFPGPAPGPASARLQEGRLTLENQVLSVAWKVPAEGSGFQWLELVDRLSGKTYRGKGPAFSIQWDKGLVRGTELRATGAPQLQRTSGNPKAVRLAGRDAGWQASLELRSPDGKLVVRWQATLDDGANYVRQSFTVRAQGEPLPASTWTLLEFPGGRVEGIAEGCPVVHEQVFLGCEHPMAHSRIEEGRAKSGVRVPRIEAGQAATRTAVLGVAPAGQMRRAFLYYLQRQRAQPYHPFLHYNSWYDIAWGDRKMDEAQCLAVIDLFGRELVEKRGTPIDSFVFDDGWDDNRTLWRFHGGFPRGFDAMDQLARKYQSAVGVWLSPWGGYGKAYEERLAYGKTQGFETNRRGFSLAGPKYFQRFREVCAEMVRRERVNYFKFDGIAQGIASSGPGPEFAADIEGMLRLIEELRAIRPHLFFNVTTGSWPSPFWLLWADSIWRNGNDMGFAGAGSKRQQWITYRDMIEYQWIVRRSPLYPINSLMTQGIAQARLGHAAELGADLKEWKDEVRSFFGSGTNLQELYVTPQILTPPMWDVLAECAQWSRRRADVLADVHWVGGDPGKGEAYGFAAWSPRGAMLTLRNPAAKPASITLDAATAFELPAGAPRRYRLASPWKDDARPPLVIESGKPQRFTLAPFEVAVYDAQAE